MKNKALALSTDIIPYIKALRQLPSVKTASDAILLQQLDYWSLRYPDGFYKFLAPCDHENYKEGDSWTEELAFSSDEFRTAFSHIGIAYKSKKQFNEESDKFKGKYYCSYYDRISRKTYYIRNDELLDQDLDSLFLTQDKKEKTQISRHPYSQFPEIGDPNFYKQATPISISSIYTENTQKTTPPEKTTSQQPIVCESGGKKPELQEQDLGGRIIDSRKQEIEGSKTTLISKSDNLQLDRLTSDYYPVIKNIAPPVANFSQQAARTPETPVSKVDWGHFEGVMQSEVPRFNLQGSHKRLYGKLIERLYELDKGKIKNFLIWRLNALKNASTYKDVSINLITVLNSLNNEFKLDPEKLEGRIVEWETGLLGTTTVELPDDDDLANLSIREKMKLGIYNYGRK